MHKNVFWLSDEQWARIAPHLPMDVRGVERQDDRRVISGIVHVLKSGCHWQDCPPEYGPYTMVYNRRTYGLASELPGDLGLPNHAYQRDLGQDVNLGPADRRKQFLTGQQEDLARFEVVGLR
jgi:transposase